jgi:hypothetical protein
MSSAPYDRVYRNVKLAEAYHLIVDSKAGQREACKLAGVGKATIARYSKRDEWEAERARRAAGEAKVLVAEWWIARRPSQHRRQ